MRKIVSDLGLDYAAPAPFDSSRSLGEALLAPTRIYAKSCLAAVRTGKIKALAHITGGGLVENLPRVLPGGVAAVIDAGAWPVPDVFAWLAQAGGVAPEEMARTFNCGIGMAAVVSPGDAAAVAKLLRAEGERVDKIGHITGHQKGAQYVRIEHLEASLSP